MSAMILQKLEYLFGHLNHHVEMLMMAACSMSLLPRWGDSFKFSLVELLISDCSISKPESLWIEINVPLNHF